jgi:hypothetical protein
MKDRFELENDIISTHNFSSHIRDLSNAMLEETIDTDEVSNALEGIAVLIDLHAQKMYDTMCEVFCLNEWSDHV